MASAAEASGGSERGDRGVQARFRKLKPRPGQASEKVSEHQRARIHAATIELVDEGGYESLTVTGIARAAGVSNHTFYENFKDKEDCFRGTYELIVRHTVREILAARRGERGSRDKMRAGFRAFAKEVSEKPKAARLALIEGFNSRATFEQMQHTYGLFEALFTESFTEERDGVAPPPLVIKGIVAGLTRVARARLLAEVPEQLCDEAEELMDWTLSLCSEQAAKVCSGSVIFPQAVDPPSLSEGSHGWHGYPSLGDERTMIASAVARLAAEEGYAALTVPRIRSVAGISRRRFEEHFEHVTDCFIAAVEMLVGRVLAEAREALLGAGTWPSGIDRAMSRLCREIAEDPALVRLVFFELFLPAGEAIRWRAELIANLGSSLRAGAPTEQQPAALAAEASIGAVWAVLHHYATTGRAAELPKISATASYLLLAPAIGAEAAVKAIRAERSGSREDSTGRLANRHRGV